MWLISYSRQRTENSGNDSVTLFDLSSEAKFNYCCDAFVKMKREVHACVHAKVTRLNDP